jgi:hypothetical protein
MRSVSEVHQGTGKMMMEKKLKELDQQPPQPTKK